MSNLPPYINPADPPSFIDQNNPLLARVPHMLELGTITIPGSPPMVVWTIRSPDNTHVIMLTAEEHAMWLETASAVQLSKSGLHLVQNPPIARSGENGHPPRPGG